MQIRYSDEAREQLREIRRYIARESGYPQRARDYTNRIVAFCSGLDVFPRRGRVRDDLRLGLKLVGFEGTATIAFVVEVDHVKIIGIFYGGQDIDTFYVDKSP